jgi:manganese transport protein
VNAAILILAAATFHANGKVVTEIADAHELLAPLLGTSLASLAFAIALLCAGQSSTLTGTLAGQVVMEGFLDLRLRPWVRRLLTRSLAIVPAVVAIAIIGDQGSYQLLILSQVVLSLQLPFAVIPLIQLTGDRQRMGPFVNPPVVKVLAWAAAAVIIGLDGWMVAGLLRAWIATSAHPGLLRWTVMPAVVLLGVFLLYIALYPLIARLRARPVFSPGPLDATADRGYRRVAIALGADAADEGTLEHGLSLAKRYGAEVFLVHVAEGFGPRFFGHESDDAETRDDRQYLDRARDLAAKAGLPAQARLLYGDPAEQLAKLVEDDGVDLLIMGAHGHKLFGDLIFGSTVTPVRHLVRIPVLVVRRE